MKGFTHEARQRGGWTRARQHAAARRENPTRAESEVRDFLAGLGARCEFEYEIIHPDGQPQFIDILIKYPVVAAVEIDGSYSWHGWNGTGINQSGKMVDYDRKKSEYLQARGIPLVFVNPARGNWQALLTRVCNNEVRIKK